MSKKMANKKNSNDDTWLHIILAVLAIFAIKSIFENDNGKIISKKGKRFLSDENKMKELDKKFKTLESSNNQEEVFI